MNRRWLATVAIALLLAACDHDPLFGKGEPSDPDVLLHRLLELSVELDQLKPVFLALQGKSFQPVQVDRVQRHIGLAVGRLRAQVDNSYSSGVAVNLAGLSYDILRLDAEATARGFGGAMHTTSSAAAQELWDGMEAYAHDTRWAFEHRMEAVSLVARVVGMRDRAMAAAPWANVLNAGITAASLTSSAVSFTMLVEQGVALARLASFMRGAGANGAVLAVEGAGASAGIRLVVAGGRAVALTEAEIAALVKAGLLSVTSLNTLMAVAGKGKIADPKAFADWEKSLPKKAAPNIEPQDRFQVKWCGPEETQVFRDGKSEGWIDGMRPEDGYLLEAKHTGNPQRSPFIEGSQLPDGVRSTIREKLVKQLRKYSSVIFDPAKPPVGLEIITNDARAVPYFEKLLREIGVPGRVVVRTP